MSVLVLGSSGLVGRSLVGRLAAAGHSVVAGDVRRLLRSKRAVRT